MTLKLTALAFAAACLTATAAGAQGYKSTGSAPAPDQGFSFSGDQIQPMPDRQQISPRDPRYTQTYQQQQSGEIPKPGGGCLRYGAVGAAGGHLAGHGVLGAIAGCATGAYVRHRDKARIRDQQSAQ